MRRRIRPHLTYANVMVTLLAFVVLGGGAAYAANTIRSSDIINNEVFSADVRDDTLAGGGLGPVDLKAGSVGSSEVAEQSLKGTDIDESSFGAGVRTPGLIRSGSEDGSGEPPGLNVGGFAGVVTRRTNATNTSASEVLARTDDMTLRRQPNGGLVLRSFTSASPRNIACQGVTAAGASLPFYANVPTEASNIQVYTNAQNVVRADCHFGDSYNKNHTTSVDLIRHGGDIYWIGFITSTWNQ